jgi:hypothetical protein
MRHGTCCSHPNPNQAYLARATRLILRLWPQQSASLRRRARLRRARLLLMVLPRGKRPTPQGRLRYNRWRHEASNDAIFLGPIFFRATCFVVVAKSSFFVLDVACASIFPWDFSRCFLWVVVFCSKLFNLFLACSTPGTLSYLLSLYPGTGGAICLSAPPSLVASSPPTHPPWRTAPHPPHTAHRATPANPHVHPAASAGAPPPRAPLWLRRRWRRPASLRPRRPRRSSCGVSAATACTSRSRSPTARRRQST